MNYKQEIKEIATKYTEEEICGYLIMDCNNNLIIYKCENRAKNKKNDFEIDPSDYVKAKFHGEILLCFHSHPFTNEEPSEKDIKSSENSKLPFLIYSNLTQKFFLFIPETYNIKPFIGRKFIEDLQQCTSLVIDFYCKWKKLPRNHFFKNSIIPKNKETLENQIKKNFVKVDKKDVLLGDLLEFKMLNGDYRHFGLYVGEDYFLHQPNNGLSNKQFLNHSWQKRLCNIYRLKEL